MGGRVVHMEGNVCIGCRFGSVKIEVCVPEKCSLQEFTRQTRAFASDLKAHTGQKPIHYALTFDSDKDASELVFNVNCQCILNVKQRDCSNFTY
ncbi:MAG: hypothetical protein M1167_02755, partial [Chloroflexi bacterium]|nr:hypothetical protein [Chloroflexota bacterium]